MRVGLGYSAVLRPQISTLWVSEGGNASGMQYAPGGRNKHLRVVAYCRCVWVCVIKSAPVEW